MCNLKIRDLKIQNSNFENLECENQNFKVQSLKFGSEIRKVNGLFSGRGPVQKTFPRPTHVDNQLWLSKNNLNFCFKFGHILGLFALFGPVELLLESGLGSKTFLEPTHVVNQLWFWKYSPIFAFTSVKFGPLGLFLESGQVQKHLWDPLTQTNTSILEVQFYLAWLKLSQVGLKV